MISIWITVLLIGLSGTLGQDCSKPPVIPAGVECCKGPKGINEDAILAKCKPLLNKAAVGQSYPQNSPVLEGVIYDFACLTDCFLNETKYPIGPKDKLDPAKYKEGLKLLLKDEPEYIKFFETALDNCVKPIEDIVSKLKPPPDAKCNPRSAYLVMCLNKESYLNCPPGKWTASEPCNQTKDFMKVCNVLDL